MDGPRQKPSANKISVSVCDSRSNSSEANIISRQSPWAERTTHLKMSFVDAKITPFPPSSSSLIIIFIFLRNYISISKINIGHTIKPWQVIRTHQSR